MTTLAEDQERKLRENIFTIRPFADDTRSKPLNFYSVVEMNIHLSLRIRSGYRKCRKYPEGSCFV